MCTALEIRTENEKSFFGRNMDLSYNFNQSVMIVPRGNNRIIGMGTLIDGHPMMADAMNEDGLACAGLNFEGYAFFEKTAASAKINIPSYDFILWVLFNHKTVKEVEKNINNIELTDTPINGNTPVPTLHWMIADSFGDTAVIEKTKNGLKFFSNPVKVMTNNPTFDWHLTNLNEYLYIKPDYREKTAWCEKELKPLGVGSGTLGLPGDFSSVSRFVRIAYLRSNLPILKDDSEAVSHFFNMLDNVKMIKGGVIAENGKEAYTIYSSCMDLEKGIYYYRTYENSRINAVNLKKEQNNSEIILFPYSYES